MDSREDAGRCGRCGVPADGGQAAYCSKCGARLREEAILDDLNREVRDAVGSSRGEVDDLNREVREGVESSRAEVDGRRRETEEFLEGRPSAQVARVCRDADEQVARVCRDADEEVRRLLAPEPDVQPGEPRLRAGGTPAPAAGTPTAPSGRDAAAYKAGVVRPPAVAYLQIRPDRRVPGVIETEFFRPSGPVAATPPQSKLTAEDVVEVVEALRLYRLAVAPENGRMQATPAGPEFPHLMTGAALLAEKLPAEVRGNLWKLAPDSPLILRLGEDLLSLPWELLRDREEFLCLRYALGRIILSEAGAGGETRGAVGGRPLRFLLVCDPGAGEHSLEASGIREEASYLTSRFLRPRRDRVVSDVLVGPTPLAVIKEKLRSGAYDIVYYSGHGYWDHQKPEESCLVFADGLLMAYTIRQIYENAAPPFLFFCNACLSGKERSWGAREYSRQVMGLASACIGSGMSYVGTFWPVCVDASMLLALSFFEGVLGEGISYGAALTAARRAVVAQFGMTRTDWAAFALYGDPEQRIDW